MKEVINHLDQLNYFTHKQAVALGTSYSQITQWLGRAKKKKTVYSIKKGIYITNVRLQKLINTGLLNHWLYYIACEVIYPGAVISLESGLSLHQVIPEMVTNITCTSIKKTYKCKTIRTDVYYRSIKTDMNRGYNIIIKEKMLVRIADAEKSLIDRLWLRNDVIREEKWFEELRLDFDSLDLKKLTQYVHKLNSPKMNKILLFLNKIRG